MQDVLHCRKICKIYQEGDNSTPVLNNISLSINAGEHVAILGSSGSGKSTLLHLLGALDQPTSGSVLFEQQDIFAFSNAQQAKFRNQSLGFVYQAHHLLPEFSALENVAMPRLIANEKRDEALHHAEEMLNKVGLSHRLTHRPSMLSGGERQRVAIARALVNQPKLVLADEPTGNLDTKTGEGIYQLLNELRDLSQTSFIVVTHDIQLAKRLDRSLSLVNGQLSSPDV